MNELLKKIEEKKKKLDSFKPFNSVIRKNIDDWLRIELTYNSNAIEGNTLTRIDTMLVVEKGITAKGKSLSEHQEAINHAKAFDYLLELVQKGIDRPLKQVVFDIHSIILDRINDNYKGRYRDVQVRIKESSVILPNPLKVPENMADFYKKMAEASSLSAPEKAIIAHFELVSIHPFIDGNGRTGRLLANYILMKNGFAPALIKKEERKVYIDSLEEYQILGKSEKYYAFMYRAIERGLNEYLRWFEKPTFEQGKKLLKIGELAALSGVSIATIRHWDEIGLLEPQDHTKGGYNLYNEAMSGRIKKIRALQDEGFRLDKIKLKILG